MLFYYHGSKSIPPISFENKEMQRVVTFKLLGAILETKLTWNSHIFEPVTEFDEIINALNFLARMK